MGDHRRLDPAIAAHYAGVPEQRRLGPFSMERVRTWELLVAPPAAPPAVVLDVGGAAGVYALPLAAGGYQVHLVDPLAPARGAGAARPRRRSRRPRWPGAPSATPASWTGPTPASTPSCCWGPVPPHRPRRPGRGAGRGAAGAAPGGVVVAAAITRFASLLDGLVRGHLDEPAFAAIVERDLRDGQHRNPTGRPEWFTTAYFHRPEELGAEVAEAGLAPRALLAVEGPAGLLADVEERLADPARREQVLAAIRRGRGGADLLGASAHLLAVALRR